MKTYPNLCLFIATICLLSCGRNTELPETENFYGNVIDTLNIQTTAEVFASLESSGRIGAKLEGKILETCAKKGCWMRVAVEKDTVMVMFKDYGFFVPTGGAEGKKTYLEGTAYFDTITVAERQHFAEDAGKSPEEIAAISTPEYTLGFEAEGVIIVQ
jgi:hypothetical protein